MKKKYKVRYVDKHYQEHDQYAYGDTQFQAESQVAKLTKCRYVMYSEEIPLSIFDRERMK